MSPVRFLATAAMSFALGVVPAVATTDANRLTVLLQFDQPHSAASLEVMQREAQRVLDGAGLRLDFRFMADIAPGESFPDVVMVKMRGKCRMEPVPMLYDERGPLAITHSSDGQVLPFSEVACDRIRLTIRQAMHGGQLGQGDELLGRALGRVLAHEMYHMLAQTPHHGDGVARECLSGKQLIAESLAMDARSLGQIARRAKRPPPSGSLPDFR